MGRHWIDEYVRGVSEDGGFRGKEENYLR